MTEKLSPLPPKDNKPSDATPGSSLQKFEEGGMVDFAIEELGAEVTQITVIPQEKQH